MLQHLNRVVIYFLLAIFCASCSVDEVDTSNVTLTEKDGGTLDRDADMSVDESSLKDCVIERDFDIQKGFQIEELAQLECEILKGNIHIDLRDDTRAIESLGALKKIEGGISFGDSQERGRNQNLSNIKGFRAIEVVTGGLFFAELPYLEDLSDFSGLSFLGGFYMHDDSFTNNRWRVTCQEVENLSEQLVSRGGNPLDKTSIGSCRR